MKIIVDAFGGDHAPEAVLEGVSLAIEEYPDITIGLVGKREVLLEAMKKQGISSERVIIEDAPDVIDVHEDPFEIRRSKKNSSMGVGLRLLADGKGDAFVSAGSTGALAVGSSFVVRRMKGVRRAALAPILPSATGPMLLLDAGANLECRPEMLLQFAVMGSIYMQQVIGVSNPRIGLANVGTEETKGTKELRETYQLLEAAPMINFVGNVEARDLLSGVCDVVVADGLIGNMILKSIEGAGSFLIHALKDLFYKNTKTKLAAGLLHHDLREFKKLLDYTEQGGAIFLGASCPVIKAHGSSDAKAFKNAIRQAHICVDKQIVEEIKNALATLPNKEENDERV